MTFLLIIVIGAVAGLLGGTFGVGGGIVMVPAFLLLLKEPVHTAIGTSLMVVIPISIAGALRHYTLNNVHFSIVLWAGLGGIIGAVLGASIIEHVPALYVKRAFALFLIYSAVRLWIAK